MINLGVLGRSKIFFRSKTKIRASHSQIYRVASNNKIFKGNKFIRRNDDGIHARNKKIC